MNKREQVALDVLDLEQNVAQLNVRQLFLPRRFAANVTGKYDFTKEEWRSGNVETVVENMRHFITGEQGLRVVQNEGATDGLPRRKLAYRGFIGKMVALPAAGGPVESARMDSIVQQEHIPIIKLSEVHPNEAEPLQAEPNTC
jgi:hypothetical protein